jgi:HEXXH motif-containing protein
VVLGFQLPEKLFEQLSLGYGGYDAVRYLQTAQQSKRMLMISALAEAAGSAQTDAAYELLSEAQRASGDAFAETLREPHVGSWLAFCLRRIRASSLAESERDIAHLSSIAVACAIRAGIEFEIELRPTDNRVFLPGLGTVSTGEAATVTAGLRDNVLTITGSTGWLRPHVLACTADDLRVEIVLDDLDPYRDCNGCGASDRLAAETVAQWQRLLDGAWPMLVTHHRRYADGIAAGLRNIVPLASRSAHRGVNATSMESFGSISLTAPVDETALAVAMVHEFQHGKLGALLDLHDLYDPADDLLCYAPWREDPRPVGALLQGVYAFQAVAEFWRVRRGQLQGGTATLAETEYVRWRDHVWRALQVLQNSGRFNALGTAFLAGLRRTQAQWQEDDVPQRVQDLAREARSDHRVAWRLRNRRPDPEIVEVLAGSWLAGRPAPRIAVPTTTMPAEVRHLERNPRMELIRLRVNDPDAPDASLAGATPGDVAYANGDVERARDAYAREAAEHPELIGAWVGLALAADQAADAAAPALNNAPEVVLAVHGWLAVNGSAPEPLALSRWMATVTGVSRGDADQVGGGSTTQ